MTADHWKELAEWDRPGTCLSELTTYRIGGSARHALYPTSTADVAAILRCLSAAGLDWRVLGGGANVLIDDSDHSIPVVLVSSLDRIESEGGLFRVGAGVPFQGLMNTTTRAGWSGLEWLAGIPGQMGGICAMNAGGRFGEVCDVVESIEFVTEQGVIQNLPPDAIAFHYRGTGLPKGIVTQVTLRLTEDDPVALKSQAAEILRAKRESQPLTIPSGGCIFRNPDGIPAGQLVEELGLKGTASGGARISPVHGNFIVNESQARFSDVLSLIETIETQAAAERGIDLVREIKIWESVLTAD